MPSQNESLNIVNPADRKTFEIVRLPDYVYENKEPFVSGARARVIEQIDKAPDGGFLCYFQGLKYPIRGFMDPDAIAACNLVKKYLRAWLGVLSSPFALPFLVLAPLLYKQWLSGFADFAGECLGYHFYQQQFYSPAVGELRRAGLQRYGNEKYGVGSRIVKATCTILENDRPYRYWLQDLLGGGYTDENGRFISFLEMIAKRPVFGLWKATEALVKRNRARDWRKARWLIMGLTVLWPRFRREIRAVAKEIDFDKVSLKDEDLYYLLLNENYDTMGMDYRQRLALWQKLDKQEIPVYLQRISSDSPATSGNASSLESSSSGLPS